MYVYMLNIISKKWIASTQMFKLTAIFKTHVWKTKKNLNKEVHCIHIVQQYKYLIEERQVHALLKLTKSEKYQLQM